MNKKLQKIFDVSSSWSEVLRKSGKAITGGNLNVLKKKSENLDLNKFNENCELRKKAAIKKLSRDNKIPLQKILVKDSSYSTRNLKDRLIKNGALEEICDECGQAPIHNGKPLVLQLDHINGDSRDHRLCNLRILCPNCHSQTETFCLGTRRSATYLCSCGNEKHRQSTFCRKCADKNRRQVDRPSYKTLMKFIEEEGVSATARKFKVSHTTVRRWVKHYEEN